MPRSTNVPATRRRRRKVLKQMKGGFGARSRLFRTAHETLMRSWVYQSRDRRVRKRDFRRFWIARVGILSRTSGISYSRLIAGLKKAKVALDRKILAQIAVEDPQAFQEIVSLAKKQLA